jgi:hypothetical protein
LGNERHGIVTTKDHTAIYVYTQKKNKRKNCLIHQSSNRNEHWLSCIVISPSKNAKRVNA